MILGESTGDESLMEESANKGESIGNPHGELGSDLLVAEFNYIATSAFQANEDRARVSQYFLITFGTFVAALFSTQLENVDVSQIFLAFSVVFLVNTLLGFLTILQITRLRLAWRESVLAMNQMKDQLLKEQPYLVDYFRWTTNTIPAAFKFNSVAFFLALMVALLSGLAFGAGIAFYSLSKNLGGVHWPVTILSGALTVLLLMLVYWFLLSRDK